MLCASYLYTVVIVVYAILLINYLNVHFRVPNAPKSCIAEIFNTDGTDGGSPVKNGSSRPRVIRDTPTRPRDTHSRLFGQVY